MTSSIELDFARDEVEIDELRRTDLATVSTAVLEQSYLRLPVHFWIDDVSVLLRPAVDERVWIGPADGSPLIEAGARLRSVPLRRLPVLAFTVALVSGIATAASSGSATMTVTEGGVIKLRKSGSAVTVVTELRKSLETSFDDLSRAIDAFRRRVTDFLDEEFPTLRATADLAWLFGPGDRHSL